jgi:hypothetical protein
MQSHGLHVLSDKHVMFVCVRVRACKCVRACWLACLRACMCTHVFMCTNAKTSAAVYTEKPRLCTRAEIVAVSCRASAAYAALRTPQRCSKSALAELGAKSHALAEPGALSEGTLATTFRGSDSSSSP